MAYKIAYNEEKNQLLKSTRGINFLDIIEELEKGNVIADLSNLSFSRAKQRILVVRINNYAFAIPYVINYEKEEIFLKTIYPSRKLTKQYIKKVRK